MVFMYGRMAPNMNIMKDGSKFRGKFKNGLKNGDAVEVNKEGIRFEGSYLNDMRDGNFTERDRNGQIIRRGTYRNGRIESTY